MVDGKPASDAPQVSVLVLNFNGVSDTLPCLQSLRQLNYSEYSVLVVDNGSTDESVDVITRAHPEVKVMEASRNLGYAAGNNLGLEYILETDAEYAMVLNNDTIVSPNCLAHLVNAIEADPNAGVAAPLIYYLDHPKVIWSAGGLIDWKRGRATMAGMDQVDTGQYSDSSRPVDFASGCALLIKRSVLEQAGLFDPSFFAYYEDAEWCVRADRAGYKILFVPRAKVWHRISAVEREGSPQVHYYMTRNRMLFLRKSGASLIAWLNTLLLDYSRTLLSWTFRPKWRSKALQRRAMWRAILDYRRGHFGEVNVT